MLKIIIHRTIDSMCSRMRQGIAVVSFCDGLCFRLEPLDCVWRQMVDECV